MQAYIAGPLISEHYRDLAFYEAIADVCQDYSIQPFLPHKVTEPTDIDVDPKKVFEQNVNALENSSLLIADVSKPSHGVGSELMLAFVKKISIICLAFESSKPSRMITGNPRVETIIFYENKEDCLKKLDNYLANRGLE